MPTITFRIAICAALVLASSRAAQSGIILDHSPGQTGAAVNPPSGAISNNSDYQNFGEFISFAAGATITGMDIYTRPHLPKLNGQVVVRLWEDNSGTPGTLISSITGEISIIDDDGAAGIADVVRVHADLDAPLNLVAGASYWIGMSGSGKELGLLGLTGPNAPGDGAMARFAGTKLIATESRLGDMAFRLEGTLGAAAVPEPSSWLMGASTIGLGLALARRARGAA